MSADDQRAAKANVILAYAEQKERYSLLKKDTDAVASALERGAKNLREHPENWSFDGDSAQLRDYKSLGTLVDDIKATYEGMLRLRETAIQGGFEHLLR